LESEAASIESAVASVLASGMRTRDLARPGQPSSSTGEMGRGVIEKIGESVSLARSRASD
jgi:isocitrate/isopropylmalate dehydrogenase